MKLLILIAIILCIFLVFSPLYILFGIGKWFYHDILEWHIPDKSIKFTYDGCSTHAICKYCRKGIMQDSQGNWFLSGKYTIEDIKAMGYHSVEEFLKDRIQTTTSQECSYEKIDFNYINLGYSMATETYGYCNEE